VCQGPKPVELSRLKNFLSRFHFISYNKLTLGICILSGTMRLLVYVSVNSTITIVEACLGVELPSHRTLSMSICNELLITWKSSVEFDVPFVLVKHIVPNSCVER
jgi:hypothetical protein